MKYSTIRKYRIDVFILLSFLLHLLFGYFSGFIKNPPAVPKASDPMKVTFLEEKKPAQKPELQGQVIEAPKPQQEEKPLSNKALSQYDSRMHSNVGKQAEEYKDNKTVIPVSKPQAAAPPPPAAEKKVEPLQKRAKEETVTKELEKAPAAQEKFKKLAKQEEREERTEDVPSSSVIRKKYKESDSESRSTTAGEQPDQKSFLTKSPLLDGTDLEKYARLDTGAAKEEATADSDTISLDTQEFKYASYFAQIKRKIELVWSYPPEAGRQGLFGKLLLKFTILKDGTLADMKLIDSAGHQILDEEALRAVKMASPYPPFPKRIDKEKLNIVASFSYYPAFSLVQ